jgi:uncharacterized protein YkwD
MKSPLFKLLARVGARSSRYFAVVSVGILLLSGLTPTGMALALERRAQPEIDGGDVARRIHAYVNEERARHGLAALAWDAKLARIAGQHSRDMAKRNYLSHDSPEGRGFDDRYRQAGYSCAVRVGRVVHAGAENIALGRLYNSMRTRNGVVEYDWNSAQQIARKVVDGWMSSRGHRKNILTPHWRHEGIGVEIHPDNKAYVTQNFC